jgi:hypothetical protein
MRTSGPPSWQVNDLHDILRGILGPKVTTVSAVVLMYNFVWKEGIFIAKLFGGVLAKIGNFSINDRSDSLPAISSIKQVDWTVK